jgi:hypothetical protein
MRKIYIKKPQAQDTRFLHEKYFWCEKKNPQDRSPFKQFYYQQLREYISLF